MGAFGGVDVASGFQGFDDFELRPYRSRKVQAQGFWNSALCGFNRVLDLALEV